MFKYPHDNLELKKQFEIILKWLIEYIEKNKICNIEIKSTNSAINSLQLEINRLNIGKVVFYDLTSSEYLSKFEKFLLSSNNQVKIYFNGENKCSKINKLEE